MPKNELIDELIPVRVRKFGYLGFLIAGVLFDAVLAAFAGMIITGLWAAAPAWWIIVLLVWSTVAKAPTVVAIFYLNQAPGGGVAPDFEGVPGHPTLPLETRG